MRLCGLIAAIAIALSAAVVCAGEAPSTSEPLTLAQTLREALARHPNLRLARAQLDESEGYRRQAEGRFDYTLTSELSRQHSVAPLLPSQRTGGSKAVVSDTTVYQIELAHELQLGTVLIPNLTWSHNETENSSAENSDAAVAFTLIQPLLAGRGPDSTAGELRATALEAEARRLALEQAAAETVLAAMDAFWMYVHSSAAVAILTESERMAGTLIEETGTLVKGGEQPQSDLKRLQANQSDKTARRLEAEQDLYRARQALGAVMGVDAEAIDTLPPPKMDYPVSSGGEIGEELIESMRDEALNRRADYRAAQVYDQAAQARVAKAQRDNAPQLDLTLEAGYAGVSEGSTYADEAKPFSDKAHGPNLYAELSFQWPLLSLEKEGRLATYEAIHRVRQTRAEELARQIRIEVAQALADLRFSDQLLDRRKESIGLYERSVIDEKEKHKAGLSTLIDIILTEDLLTNAKLDVSRAQYDRAVAVARVRYAVGALLAEAPQEAETEAEGMP